MFEIEKNVQVPVHSWVAIYNFGGMEVGDSFTAPRDMGSRGRADSRRASISSAAIQYAKRSNPAAKFTTRIIDDDTVRCWRIA